MYEQIKKLADEAIALQNKNRMDAVLREISALCAPSVANQSIVDKIAADTGCELKTYGEAALHVFTAPGTPNPVVLDGPAGEIVARSPEADAYLAAYRDAQDTGTGMVSVSLNSDGKINAEHIPAAELRAEPPAPDPAPITPEPSAPAAKAKKGGAK